MADDPLSRLARAAADEVQSGMHLGLGTGSTAGAVIRELGTRVVAGLAISGVPTSERTARLATEVGIPLTTLDAVDRLDLGIDGADEIEPGLGATKGLGGALVRERLVALACDDYLLVAAAAKLVPRLGSRAPLPVEVVRFGWRQTAVRLAALGLRPNRRAGGDGLDDPYLTDGGNVILDCGTDPIADPTALADAVKAIHGVVDHGLFLGIARRALIAEPDGRVRALRAPEHGPRVGRASGDGGR